jgi:TonB family protein
VKPQRDKQFERTLRRAEVEPTPQSSRTIQDVLNSRVATLQRQETEAAPVRPLALDAPTPQAGMQLAEVGDSPQAAPVDLHRKQSGAKPVPLVRAGTGLPSSSVPQLATVKAPKMEPRSKPQDVDRADVRDLAGASIMGPIADRPVVHTQSPLYPDWAEYQGVEASVSLYFVVRPDGRIKENILVEKTSGFEDFDANAVSALRAWRFEALGPGSSGEQWGRITFHYRLSSG